MSDFTVDNGPSGTRTEQADGRPSGNFIKANAIPGCTTHQPHGLSQRYSEDRDSSAAPERYILLSRRILSMLGITSKGQGVKIGEKKPQSRSLSIPTDSCTHCASIFTPTAKRREDQQEALSEMYHQ